MQVKVEGIPNLVLLGVSKEEIEQIALDIEKSHTVYRFYEPDWDNSFTAFSVGPVVGSERDKFKQFKLLK